MNCLIGYIGLRGCSGTAPVSNRYVNSLPGISLKAVDNMANSEQITYAQVWSDVQERAIADLSTKVTALFAERFRLKKVLDNIDLGEAVDATDNQTAASAQYRGFTYELKFAGDYYSKPSALQVVYVQRLKLYLKSAGSVTVKIYDLDLKKELYTTTITGVVGWNYINVYQAFSAHRLFFGYDTTAIISPYQKLLEYAQGCCSGCVTSIYGHDCDGWLRGATASTADPYTVTQGTNIYGLSAEFSLHCSFDNVVCSNKKVFELALWYKLGEELMVERLASPRFNLTTIDTKEAEELRAYFMNKFDEELKLAVNGIDLDLNDCCIECNAPVTYQTSRM